MARQEVIKNLYSIRFDKMKKEADLQERQKQIQRQRGGSIGEITQLKNEQASYNSSAIVSGVGTITHTRQPS